MPLWLAQQENIGGEEVDQVLKEIDFSNIMLFEQFTSTLLKLLVSLILCNGPSSPLTIEKHIRPLMLKVLTIR